MWRKVAQFFKQHHVVFEWWAEILLCVAAAIGWAIALIFMIERAWGY